MSDTDALVRNARARGLVVPAFNIPYLPMMEPVVRAVCETGAFALIDVARLEWLKFEAGSPARIRQEYERCKNPSYTRLHLDHVPVIDEDGLRVDYKKVISTAVELGFQSVMVDGSRLSLDENIEASRHIADLAHSHGIPAEAELGAVLGHEAGPLPPYEELYASGKGFTDPEEAKKFVSETHVDWLSVSIGNIHGAVAPGERDKEKIAAKLNIEHLKRIYEGIGIPIVLHGGSGIPKSYILQGINSGITKINIGTAIRKAYEKNRNESISRAQNDVYDEVVRILDDLEVKGSARKIAG